MAIRYKGLRLKGFSSLDHCHLDLSFKANKWAGMRNVENLREIYVQPINLFASSRGAARVA